MAEQITTRKPKDRALRKGWTTGACATAAASAAYAGLLTGEFPDPVHLTLKGGQRPAFPLAAFERAQESASASVVKDAGDDPDVTHGALVSVSVRRGAAGEGVQFYAGEGVGTVTRPGLPLGVGEPAINPGPRRMMVEALSALAGACGVAPDVAVTISVPGGEKLAERTMNARLGIIGGLSILGTTGIVTPYSCAAWIASIHQGIDVARAAGLMHVAGATGRRSEQAVAEMYALPETALIEMGDFAGGMLKYLRAHPVPRLTIAGGFGKISKLAAGHLDLHSSRSQVDLGFLNRVLAALDPPPAVLSRAHEAQTAGELLECIGDFVQPLGTSVAQTARAVARGVIAPERMEVDVAIFDRSGRLIAHADG